jgi:hypothetical protein
MWLRLPLLLLGHPPLEVMKHDVIVPEVQGHEDERRPGTEAEECKRGESGLLHGL